LNFTENSSTRLLVVHREMDPVELEAPADIILTPQFYTMKKESLPLKYAYQAKRIAPSLFDGLLESDKVYAYFVYREKRQWIFIAYCPDELAAFFRIKGISSDKVRKLFFAQQVAAQIDNPITLGKRDALMPIEGTVTVVPLSVLKENTFMDPSTLSLPKKGIRLESGRVSLLDKKQIWMLSGVFFLFAVVWFVEGERYNTNNTILKKEITRLYEAYPSLQNSYTRENIAEKYRKIDKVERKKRHIIGKIAGLIFKGVTLTGFEMDQKHFQAIFVTSDSRVAKRLEALLKSANLKKRMIPGKNQIIVEGSL